MVRDYFANDEAETQTREMIAHDPKLTRGNVGSRGLGSHLSAPCCVTVVPALAQKDGQYILVEMQCQELHMHYTYFIPMAMLQGITGPILRMRKQTCTWNILDKLGPCMGPEMPFQQCQVEREPSSYMNNPGMRLLVFSDRCYQGPGPFQLLPRLV